MKRRIILILVILVTIGLVVLGIGWYVRRSRGPRLLARAELALRAEELDRALELAKSYVAKHPEDWRGYFLQGRACNRLGRHAQAREHLEGAARLNASEPSIRMALADTHALPASRSLAATGVPPQSARLTEAIDALRKANGILSVIEVEEGKIALDIRQQIGLNHLQIGAAQRLRGKVLEREAEVAEAGGATELRDAKTKASKKALADAEGSLDEAARALLEVVTADPTRDRAARPLVELCRERNDEAALAMVRKAISVLADPPPVAAALLSLHALRSTTQPEDSAEYRQRAEETCRTLDDLLARHPNEHEVKLARAELALVLEDLTTAERLCAEVLKVDSAQARARLIDAKIDMEKGNFAEAERKLNALRTTTRNRRLLVEAHLAYGLAAAANGRKELAKTAMRKVTELAPGHPLARRYLAESLLRDGFFKEAFEDAQAYYRAHPDEPAAVRLFVEAAKRTDRDELAREAVEAARNTDRPEMLMALAECYAVLGDNAGMLKAAQEAARSQPITFDARMAVARAMMLTGRAPEAEGLLRSLLSSHRRAHRAHFELANLYQRMGRSAQALEYYRAAVRLEDHNINYRLALAQTLFDSALLEECLAECRAVLRREPNMPAAVLLISQVNIIQGQPVSVEQLVSETGAGRRGGLSLALTLLGQGQPNRCAELCRAELAKTPDNPQYRFLLGRAHLVLGQRDKCVEQWTLLLKAAPDRLPTYLHLAGVLSADNKPDKVQSTLAALPEARPEMVDLAMGWLYDRRRDYQRSAEAFARVAGRGDLPEDLRQRAAMYRARSLARAGDIDHAIKELDRLADEGSWRTTARLAKAQLLAAADRDDELDAILEELTKAATADQDLAILARVARFYSRMDSRLDKALGVCDQIQSALPGDARGYLAKANILARAGRLPESFECYRKAIERQPGNLGLYLALARALEADRELLKAMEVLSRLESLGSAGQSEALFQKGLLMARYGLRTEAVEHFEQLAKTGHERDPRLQLALGRVFLQLGRKDQARTALERIPQYVNAYVAAQQMLADLADSPPDKLAVLDRLERIRPGQAGVLGQRMSVLVQAGRAPDAVKAFAQFRDKYLTDRPAPPAVADLALQVMLVAGDRAAAADLAGWVFKQTGSPRWRVLAILLLLDDKPDAALALMPDIAKAGFSETLLGLCLAPRGGVPAARWQGRLTELVDSSAKASPTRPMPLPYQLLAALASGNKSQAKDILAKMDKSAGLVSRTVAAELVAASGGSAAEAVVMTKASLALDSGVAVLAREWAISLLKERPACQWAAAVALMAGPDVDTQRQVLALVQPADCVVSRVARASLLIREGRFLEAAELYGQAAKAAGNDPGMLMTQAGALESGGRLAEALKIYRDVWTATASAAAANNAAYLVSQLSPQDVQQLSEVKTWLEAATKAAPNNPAFRDTKGWIVHLHGQPRQAIKDLRFAVKGMPDSAEVHYHVAVVESAIGNKELARWHLAAAVGIGERHKREGRPIQPGAAKAVEASRSMLAKMDSSPS